MRPSPQKHPALRHRLNGQVSLFTIFPSTLVWPVKLSDTFREKKHTQNTLPFPRFPLYFTSLFLVSYYCILTGIVSALKNEKRKNRSKYKRFYEKSAFFEELQERVIEHHFRSKLQWDNGYSQILRNRKLTVCT